MGETRPIRSMNNTRWPYSHLNAGSAAFSTLLAAPGRGNSHYVTGFLLGGGGDADGFHLIRNTCIKSDGTDTWTIPDTGTVLDWDTKANDGDFTLEIWLKMGSTVTTVPGFMRRGDETSDGWALELAAGKPKFTVHDGANSATITATTTINNGKWYLVTVTVDRSSATGLNIYVNGTIAATPVDVTSVTAAVDGGTTAVYTGIAAKDIYLGPVGMYIDAFLSAATVLSNYERGIGRKYTGSETDLTIGYNNDEGVGTTNFNESSTGTMDVTNSGIVWIDGDGPPFDREGSFKRVGKFVTGALSTNGVFSGMGFTFPHAVKIGNNNPLRINETDGAFDLILFGYTDAAGA